MQKDTVWSRERHVEVEDDRRLAVFPWLCESHIVLCAHSVWRARGREEVGARVVPLRIGIATLKLLLYT
jgi:hypothetical protein